MNSPQISNYSPKSSQKDEDSTSRLRAGAQLYVHLRSRSEQALLSTNKKWPLKKRKLIIKLGKLE